MPGPVAYVRLRRRVGDTRLYVTSNGTTDTGYLASAGIDIPGPILHLELEEHPSELYGDGTDAAFYEIPVNRILLADVQALEKTVRPVEHPFHKLVNALNSFRPDLSEAEPPVCGHEDVVETPQMGSATIPGICYWCPTPLVQDEDRWVPA